VLDALSQPYVIRALLELAILAPVAGALGVFAILRRQVFTAHAIGVGALPGIVLAVAAGVPALIGGLAAGGLLSALALRLGVDVRRGDPAAVSGVLLAGAIGLGALLVSAGVGGSGVRIDALLFGSLLGITDLDIARTALVALVATALLLGLRRSLELAAFDRDAARAAGIGVGRHELVLALLIAVVVVVAVEAVGALLASALVVLPAAAALRLTRRVGPAMAVAAALALLAGVVGVLIADRWSLPPGATVVLVAAALWPIAIGIAHARTMRLGRGLAAAGALGAVAVLGACGGGTAPGDGGTDPGASATTEAAATGSASPRLQVVATTPIVADWARQVGGDAVEVATIMPPGVDTHDFEPTPEAARAIAGADVVVASGAGLDGWVEDLVAGAGGSARLVDLAPEGSLLAADDGHGHDEHGHDEHGHDEHGHEEDKADDAHDHGPEDPHYWHDPTLAIAAVGAIADALAEADPAHADGYAARAEAYQAEIAALDAELAAALAEVPGERRRIATDHDALAYLGAHYGIGIVGAAIPSTSGAASADAQTLARLIDVIREQGVTTVVAEATTDPSVAEVLAAETGATLVDGVYGDTLAPEGEPAGTYLGMMRGNVLLIVQGLRG
jgi:ABC-type Zn uptake system ZnuABC Zn-binding protein ZnuA/ABC-type Mn2+/Zn2+ transport system permease subunit